MTSVFEICSNPKWVLLLDISGITLSISTFTLDRVREGEEREEHQKCILWNCGWKLSKPEVGNRYPATGSPDGPKQDEPKAFN